MLKYLKSPLQNEYNRHFPEDVIMQNTPTLLSRAVARHLGNCTGDEWTYHGDKRAASSYSNRAFHSLRVLRGPQVDTRGNVLSTAHMTICGQLLQ